MVRYRRNFLPSGTFFFTAALADRTSSMLIDQILALRTAMSRTKRDHPFTIDAAVILPDHLHLMMTLPQDDANFSARWYLIKRRFTAAVRKTGIRMPRRRNGEIALWQRIGSTRSGTKQISSGTLTTFISIRSSMGL
jgi:putative transposase